jgi:hypothetical protein
MLNATNRAALRLWKDESGVVLALTVIVFLSLFMMASAIFAGGEAVRRRIELQNAADSAAYSAAIIQADCNSRLAVINRAMSWTYVQMVRMEMDYIVDKWLWLTLQRWDLDNTEMKLFNMPSTCNKGLPWYGTGYGVFVGNGFSHKRILLNKHQYVTTDEIKSARNSAAGQGKSYSALAPKITRCRNQINAMNDKEKELLRKLPDRIEKTVKEILKANIRDTWNDGFAGGGGIMYVLKQEKQPLDNTFRVLEQKEEEDFLRHSDYIPEQGSSAYDVFEDGTDTWFVKQYSAGGPGIQRQYKRGHPILISEWDWCSSVWEIVEGVCVPVIPSISGKSFVKGDDPMIYDPSYYITALAEPQVLKKEFFAQRGSLRVALTCRLNNPFQFMFGGGGPGVFKPFTLDGGNRFMWTVATAIAGYNPKPRNEANGKYEVTYEDNSGNKLWNLKTSDWDAELIPLHRAGALGEGRAWKGASAGAILGEMKNGPWEPLYGGGGALGAQGAPKLMSEGAEVDYGAAEGWVLH